MPSVFHIKPINSNNTKTYEGSAFVKKYYNLTIMVYWDVTTSSMVHGCKHFGGTCLPNYTAPHSKRPIFNSHHCENSNSQTLTRLLWNNCTLSLKWMHTRKGMPVCLYTHMFLSRSTRWLLTKCNRNTMSL